MALDGDKVVDAALGLLSEEGIDAVTTRRLAQELGVQGPALYWHFKNKQQLFDHMVARLFQVPFPASPSDDWAVSLAASSRDARRIILSYRDGARLVAGSLPVEHNQHKAGLALLQKAGFTPAEALNVYLLLSRFVIGWTLAEQSLRCREEPPPPGHDHEAAFEFGLQAIMAGLELTLERRRG